jgi:hypothetical protein
VSYFAINASTSTSIAFGAASGDIGFGLDDLDLAGLHRGLDAADEFADHLVLALDYLAVVEGGAVHADSVFVAVEGIVVHFGAVEQRLGRDAAFIEADASQFFPLEEDDAEAQGAGAFRRDISSGTSADDCKIVHILVWFIRIRLPGFRSPWRPA